MSPTWSATPPWWPHRGHPKRAITCPRTWPTTPSPGCADTRPSTAGKPFFMYWASGCLHGPHHVMKEWADKYVGKFDDGWDAYRQRVFERAKTKGWIPQDCSLTERDETLTAWDDIPEDEKPFQRRLMEVAMRLRRARRRPGRSHRRRTGSPRLRRQHAVLLHLGRQRFLRRRPERHHLGTVGPERDPHHGASAHRCPRRARRPGCVGVSLVDNQYHAGWAWAGSTPYKGMKLLASHLGGTRNPMVVRW